MKRPATSEPLGIIASRENASAGAVAKLLREPWRPALSLAALSMGLLLSSSVARFQPTVDPSGHEGASSSTLVIELPPPNLLRPLSPEEATKENAERAFVKRPDTPAGRFVLRSDAENRERALTCLAQAVYYEAAGEGTDGGRAVAQVVLNRVRHPGYPASICGVVYQGADRTTGCQFTFTCDGSLLQAPIASLWNRSRKIAEEALAGRVFVAIGHATHYHADYVLPYWADSLDKSVQLGRHIFYRLRGSLGDSRAFSQRYAGIEPEPEKPGTAVILPPTSETEQLANALINDGTVGRANEVEKAAAEPVSPLAIDTSRGTLIADGQAAAVTSRKTLSTVPCAANAQRKQLAPLGANDLRPGASPTDC